MKNKIASVLVIIGALLAIIGLFKMMSAGSSDMTGFISKSERENKKNAAKFLIPGLILVAIGVVMNPEPLNDILK